MLKEIRATLASLVLLGALTGGLYPLVVTAISQAAFPHQAAGSLVRRGSAVVGSELIGQSFAAPGYFHARPSATTDPDPKDPSKTVAAPYEASASSGSNAGPTSKSLVDRVRSDVGALRQDGGSTAIPVDLVTTSASGLDPDVSPAAAYYQVERVAKARGFSLASVRALVDSRVRGRTLGLLGEPVVNVLELNLALDRMGGAPAGKG